MPLLTLLTPGLRDCQSLYGLQKQGAFSMRHTADCVLSGVLLMSGRCLPVDMLPRLMPGHAAAAETASPTSRSRNAVALLKVASRPEPCSYLKSLVHPGVDGLPPSLARHAGSGGAAEPVCAQLAAAASMDLQAVGLFWRLLLLTFASCSPRWLLFRMFLQLLPPSGRRSPLRFSLKSDKQIAPAHTRSQRMLSLAKRQAHTPVACLRWSTARTCDGVFLLVHSRLCFFRLGRRRRRS